MQEDREQNQKNQPPGQPAIKNEQQVGHEQRQQAQQAEQRQRAQQAGQQFEREQSQGAQMGQGSQGQRRQPGQGDQSQQSRQQGEAQQQHRQQGQENFPATRTQGQGGQQSSAAPLSGLVEQGKHIRQDAQALTMSVGESVQLFSRYMTEQVEQRPYTTLGVAVGVGYLLGGGLATRITGTALGTAYRLALALAARELSHRMSIPGISAESADSGRFSS